MIDLLAAIVHTDPAPIAGWMLLLLAIGMYPVGILLPSCCMCGSTPCSNCPTGTLPETVTVTFPAWDDEMLGAYRHRIAFGAPPEWTTPRSRASARVSETVNGEITKIDIVDGGSGYALVGRVAPTLTLSGGGGTGATFTPTLSSSGTPAVWTLDSATASGGSGYVDGSSLTITAAAGDTTVTKATATVVARSQPTVTATGPGGSGASLSVSLSQSGSPPTWAVSAVTVAAGGTGYTHEGAVTFTAANSTTLAAPAAKVRTLEPASHTVDASGAGGSGATFSITYEEETDPEFAGYYYITGIAVTNGGSGYSSGGTVLLRPNTGTRFGVWPDGNASDIVLGYTLSGDAIASVSGFDNEVYYRDRGIIQSVTVTSGGSLYGNIGPAYGVTVTGGGSYYREDKTAAPYVANVTATVENGGVFGNTPSLTPVVDDDPNSATFGKIVSVTINDGGGGHSFRVLNIGKRCCKSVFANRSFVLRRTTPNPCQFVYEKCEGLGTTRIELTLPAISAEYGRQPVYLTTVSGGGCETTWTATTLVDDCSTLLPAGASPGDTLELEAGSRIATVVPGGTYTAGTLPGMCSRCCTSGTLPDEIEVGLEMAPAYGSAALDGTYVLEAGNVFGGSLPAAWSYSGDDPFIDPTQHNWVRISVAYQHCGEWTTPPGIRKVDPGEDTDLVGVRDGFSSGDAIRQSIGVIAGDFELPNAPPPPEPVGWVCPVGDIDTPYANDAHPGATVDAQDYVSHCGTDCSDKCFSMARVLIYTASNQYYNGSEWDDSKPRGAPFVHEEEAGRPKQIPIDPNANPVTYAEGYLDKVISGYEVFFSYFDIPYCGGAFTWTPPILGTRPGFWSLQSPPVVDIANVWPGRDRSQATCEACESNLCAPHGELEIKRPGDALWATVTIQQ